MVMFQTAYEVRDRDGKISWERIDPNPLLEYTARLVGPPEKAHFQTTLLVASFAAASVHFGTYESGLEIWVHEQKKDLSELAKKYECIGVCTMLADTLLLFPTIFDLLGFLTKYSGTFERHQHAFPTSERR